MSKLPVLDHRLPLGVDRLPRLVTLLGHIKIGPNPSVSMRWGQIPRRSHAAARTGRYGARDAREASQNMASQNMASQEQREKGVFPFFVPSPSGRAARPAPEGAHRRKRERERGGGSDCKHQSACNNCGCGCEQEHSSRASDQNKAQVKNNYWGTATWVATA